jgi:hypothetical protein
MRRIATNRKGPRFFTTLPTRVCVHSTVDTVDQIAVFAIRGIVAR